MKGIDISSYQGVIDWEKVKSQIDFAILRLGYGDNIESQDDKCFLSNAKSCIDKGIPFGVYIYSYAKNLSGSESIQSEIDHTLRLLKQISQKPFCVYIDMEDKSTEYLQKLMLTNFALEFCKQIKNAGYNAGVYANQNWFTNFLNCSTIASYGYSIWVAKYSDSKPNITSNYDIWQYSSTGKIEGINGNVDMNTLYNKNLINEVVVAKKETTTTTGVITYQAYTNKWYSEVNKFDDTEQGYAGLFGKSITLFRCKPQNGELIYQAHVKGGKWLSEVSSKDYSNGKNNSYAGIYGKPIDAIRFKATVGNVTYQVHTKGGEWLPIVTKYGDRDDEYAGIYGKEIDGIRIK